VDVEVDRLTTKIKDRDPKANPILTGEISLNSAFLLVILLLLFAICFALLVSYIFTSMLLIGIFGAIICYSLLYFKSKAPLDLIFPLTAAAPPLIGGYYMDGNPSFPTFRVVIYTLLAVVLFLETEINDIGFDSLLKIYTTAVRVGRSRSRTICYSLYVTIAVSSTLGYLATKDFFFAFMASASILAPVFRSLMLKAKVLTAVITTFIIFTLLS